MTHAYPNLTIDCEEYERLKIENSELKAQLTQDQNQNVGSIVYYSRSESVKRFEDAEENLRRVR